MENISLILSVLSIIPFCFFTIRQLSIKLNYSNIGKLPLLLISVINALAVITVYGYGLPYIALFVTIFVVFFVSFVHCSKFQFRSSFFITTAVLINIATNNYLVLTIISSFSNLSLLEIYQNPTIFPLTIFITNVVLGSTFALLKNLINDNKLQTLANAKLYSDIMSFVSLFLVFVLTFDIIFMENSVLEPEFLLSTYSTIIFVFAMFYCILYFNIFLIKLHPYKRKADEAKNLHQRIVIQKSEAEHKLYTDDLTKLYNRRFIFAKLDELCESNSAKFGLVFLDLVSLKHVNDTYGHKAGDQYIVDIADIITHCIREDDLSARIGGDEYLLILNDISDAELLIVINRIKSSVEKAKKHKPYIFHANIGCMCFNMEQEKFTRAQMINFVDELMTADKKLFYEKGGA